MVKRKMWFGDVLPARSDEVIAAPVVDTAPGGWRPPTTQTYTATASHTHLLSFRYATMGTNAATPVAPPACDHFCPEHRWSEPLYKWCRCGRMYHEHTIEAREKNRPPQKFSYTVP